MGQAENRLQGVVIPVGRRVIGHLQHAVSQKLQRDEGAAEKAQAEGNEVSGDILAASVLHKIPHQERHAQAHKQIAEAVEQGEQDHPAVRLKNAVSVEQERHHRQHGPNHNAQAQII